MASVPVDVVEFAELPVGSNVTARFYHVKSRPQQDDFGCGFHSLKNCVLLLHFLQPGSAIRLNDEKHFWTLFNDWQQQLLGHAAEREPTESSFLEDELWRPEVISEGVMEQPYLRVLIERECRKLEEQTNKKPGEVLLVGLPELAYLEGDLVTIDRIQEICRNFQQFSTLKVGGFVISGTPSHWIAVRKYAADYPGGVMLHTISAFQRHMPNQHVVRLARCLAGVEDFCTYCLEIVVAGFLKEFQENMLEAYHVNDANAADEAFSTVRPAFAGMMTRIEVVGVEFVGEATRIALRQWREYCMANASDVNHPATSRKIFNKQAATFVETKSRENQTFHALVDDGAIGKVGVLWNALRTAESRDEGIVIRARNRAKQIGSEQINLHNYQMTRLPCGVLSTFTFVQDLVLSQNRLTEATLAEAIDRALSKMAQLEQLDLSHNRLDAIPYNIAMLSQLTELTVAHNRLTALPSAITTMTRLCYFSVSHNQIAAIAWQELSQMPNLQSLLVGHNRLTEVTLGGFQNLKNLQAEYNQLAEAPKGLASIPALKQIFLQGNKFASTAKDELCQLLAKLPSLVVWWV